MRLTNESPKATTAFEALLGVYLNLFSSSPFGVMLAGCLPIQIVPDESAIGYDTKTEHFFESTLLQRILAFLCERKIHHI